MSVHPNAILLLALTPDDLARKTHKSILTEYGKPEDDDDIRIGETDFHTAVMEEDYLEDFQISAKKGDIVVFDMVTYGYGEVMEWEKLEALKSSLEAWAKEVCEKYNCKHKIFITANYW